MSVRAPGWTGLSAALSTPLLTALFCLDCSTVSVEFIEPEPPTQQGKENPMQDRGARSFDQRQTDCWDMPSAQACYDVGLNYELGLVVEPNRATALEYYDKACSIERQPEHCEAAKRLRHEE